MNATATITVRLNPRRRTIEGSGVSMRVDIVATDDAREVLVNLMQLYLYDLSEFTGEGPAADGRYEYIYLKYYWREPNRHPFLFRVDGNPVGFGLVSNLDPGVYSMSEFFVMRKFRRAGLGQQAAITMFDKFSGTWHVAQEEENTVAQTFWRKVIGDYCNSQFSEGRSDQPAGPMQIFEST
jgi:predicted acetyltransferase